MAEHGADLIDLNMGCPVPKVCKTGAGAALIKDPDTAVRWRAPRARARAAGHRQAALGPAPGETDGYDLAHRLVHEAGVSAIGFHPRSAAVHHKGTPDYDLAARLVQSLDAPVILTGGLSTPETVHAGYERTGAAAVMLARGSLGNPWLFGQVLGTRADDPTRDEVLAELYWVMERAVEHLGADRAGRYLRKFYPWYLDRMDAPKALQQAMQSTADVTEARAVLGDLNALAAAA